MSETKKGAQEPKHGFWAHLGDILQDSREVIWRAVLSMWQSNVSLMSSGLVYSTLVALVPCITFFMAFLTVFDLIAPFMSALSALFDDLFGTVLGGQLLALINQFSSNAMGLGVFGLVSFIITATMLVNKVYTVLNQIFRTQPSTGSFKRFTTFLSFLILAVVCLALFLAVNSSLMTMITNQLAGDEPGSSSVVSQLAGALLSFTVATLLLFLLFYFVPNTKVRSRSALLGSVVGAFSLIILFNVFKMIVSRMVSYSVIYGSLASLFFVLLFLYVCWYIILTSAEIIYVHQFRPQSSQLTGGPENPARQFTDAVNMMMLIGQSYKTGQGPVSRKNLTRRLAVTPSNLNGYISTLVKHNLIVEINTGKAASYMPSRPLDQIRLTDIFDAVYGFDPYAQSDTAGEAVAEQIRLSSIDSLSDLTLENLLERI